MCQNKPQFSLILVAMVTTYYLMETLSYDADHVVALSYKQAINRYNSTNGFVVKRIISHHCLYIVSISVTRSYTSGSSYNLVIIEGLSTVSAFVGQSYVVSANQQSVFGGYILYTQNRN